MISKPVVVGTDGSDEATQAVEWAAAESARRAAPLRIVTVRAVPAHVSSVGDSLVSVDELLDSVYHQSLQQAGARAAAVAAGLTIDTELLTGSPGLMLAEEVTSATMLVVGAYGAGGFAQPGAGPETRYVALRTSCPVVVTRDPGGIEHGEIVVGVRDLDTAQAPICFAFEEAALRKAHLTVVHACDERNLPIGHLPDHLSDWQGMFPDVSVSFKEPSGHPGRLLTAFSGFSDLTVVGRHKGPNRSIAHGSVLRALLDHAQAPVAIVPAD